MKSLENATSASLQERLRPVAQTAKRWFWRALPFVMAVIFYRWAQKDGSFFNFDVVALGVAILALLVTYVVIDGALSLSVTQITIPEELQKLGWTSQTCSNRIADILSAVSEISNLPDFPLAVVERLPAISVKVGSAEFGSDVLMKFVSRMFGIASNEVGGEVVIVNGDAGWVSMRLRCNHLLVEQGPVPVKHFEGLLSSIAYALAQKRAPLATATALAQSAAFDKYRSPDVVARAVEVAHDGGNRRNLSRRERVLCRALEALLLFVQLKDKQADEALQRAEELGKDEFIVKAIRGYRNLELQAEGAAAGAQQGVETPEYDPRVDTLQRLVWTTFLYRLSRQAIEFQSKISARYLDGASGSLVTAEEKICEARVKNWHPFSEGRSAYAQWIAQLLETAEGDLGGASIWIEAHPADAGSELCERLDSLRSKLDHLKGMLAEVEASPEYVAAAGRAEESLAKALLNRRRKPTG